MNKFITLLLLVNSVVMADYTHPSVNQLIQANNDPEGVVFELIESDKDTWKWAAPMIRDLRKQLREKYPNIDIAVVSHGQEQFQLLKKRVERQKNSISILKDLVQRSDVNLHVCGAHSSWFNIPADNYIYIVDVADSGPAKINDYINLGYQLIELNRPIQMK